MRDKIKDLQYFHDFIVEEKERIDKFQEKLNNNEVREDRTISVKRKIHDLKLGIWIARFSLGEDINDLINDYKSLMYDLQKVWNTDSYTDKLWLISIGIMLEIENDVFNIIKVLIRDMKKDDWLLDYLFNYREKDIAISHNIIFKKPYKSLYEIVYQEEDKILAIKDYLEKKWYKGHDDTSWYDSHNSKEKLYYGYWSFESGAIVKILGLDDTILKDVPYYPYDLVHYGDKRQV